MSESVRLSDLIYPVRGSAARADLPVYSVTKHRGFVPSLEYFSKQVFSKDLSKYKVVQSGMFAYATIHLDEGSIGIAPVDCLISPMYTVFQADRARVLPEYLIRVLKAPDAVARYATLGRGTAERRRSISLDALGALEVPLPPLPEQRRITSILDGVDRQRAMRTRLISAIGDVLAASFDEMFGSPIDSEWPNAVVGDLLESATYGTSAKAGSVGDTAILRMGNLTNDGRLDLGDLKYLDLPQADQGRYLAHQGDVLFNRTNSAELVGKTAVFNLAEPMAYAGYLIRLRPARGQSGHYISAFLNSRYAKARLRLMAKSIVGMANINAREVQAMSIPLPPPSLQEEFTQLVGETERLRDLQHLHLAKLDELMVSLEYRAFRGEL